MNPEPQVVHTIDEMKAWLKPLGYSDTINETAINFILREFVMSKVSVDRMMNADMVVDLLRPQLKHQTSYFSHQTSSIITGKSVNFLNCEFSTPPVIKGVGIR